MDSMVGKARPDLSEEWGRLYTVNAIEMGRFLDKHFPVGEPWGMLPISDVPAIFRERFAHSA